MKTTILKSIIVAGILLFSVKLSHAQETRKITWMSFNEAVEKNKKEPRKIFIDLYTHWCGWCKRMDATTFEDDAIAKYMNDKFYNVKFDAETKDTVKFKENIFVFKPEYKANEFAVSLLNGKMGYPSFVFLDEQLNLLGPLSGYQTPEQLSPVLNFFGNDTYKTKTWEEYVKEVNGN